jgi:anaphase-promoting complex subunit 2
MLKYIDPTSHILEVVSLPIKKYLRQRKDTMRWIITTILCEEDDFIREDLGKQYIKLKAPLINSNNENEYDYLSSDEDEIAAENWQPRPILSSNLNSNKSKFSDIISTLVNIFGSAEKFVEQYKRMLAERCVSDNNFSIENEIKNLELLKIKFGENLLQGCDIIIKDVNECNKINQIINSLNDTQAKDFKLNCLIINKNFWPFKETSLFSLTTQNDDANYNSYLNESANIKIQNYDYFITSLNNKFLYFTKKFSSIKFSRTLSFFTNIGFVDLSLTFDNGTFKFRVSQLAALIINLFDEKNENYFEMYSIEFIAEKLNSSAPDVKKKINFWISKGVLTEIINNTSEGFKNYFLPNKILKNLDFNFNKNVIIEEDIFVFEFRENETKLNLENAINSIIKNSGPKNFEQLYKNLIVSYQVNISEVKLKDVLGKMILEQKIFKEGELFKLIVLTN